MKNDGTTVVLTVRLDHDLKNYAGVYETSGGAAELHGNAGGLTEYWVPDPQSQIEERMDIALP